MQQTFRNALARQTTNQTDSTITVRLSAELRDQIYALASETNTSASDVVRTAVSWAIATTSTSQDQGGSA